MRRTLVLGGPGTGKTTRLLDVMAAALRRGVPSTRIAFVTFTNAAEDTARGRAMKEFGLGEKELPYFRTIHSLAFRELGLNPNDVLREDHLAEIGELTGELFTGDADPSSPAAGRNADPLLTIDHYARTTAVSLHRAWEDHGGELDWFRLRRFSEAYRLYKQDNDLLDFTDMLVRYVESDLAPVPVEVAIVDEAQDLTIAQWGVIERAFSRAEELWVGGDDDQSIHRWAGAAEDYLLGLNYDREVLPLSHRLPRSVFDLSQEIICRVSRRFEKCWSPADRNGTIEWLAHAEEADLSSGTWLMLARTRAMLPEFATIARNQGVVYRMKGKPSVDPEHVKAIRAYEDLRAGKSVESADAEAALRAAGTRMQLDENRTYTAMQLQFTALPIWHDALVRIPIEDREYYLACLRRGEKLTAAPRVIIETIHGAKGAESENVVLSTNLTNRTYRGYELDPDSEHRVFYVGATRASERLFPVAPSGPYGYVL